MVKRNIISIGNKKIGDEQKTFIVAEIGINHNGEINLAKNLIKSAKEAGADAVKFQTYNTELRVSKNSPIYNILKKCELSSETTEKLINFAKIKDIIFFSTPFDEESVDLLVKFKVPLMKIASFDIINLKLVEKVAKTQIPTIISRGMANTAEISKAVKLFEKYGTDYAILHCISAYPTKESDANLNIIKSLKAIYNCPIGYSDHTLGIEVAYLSVVAGATIIEKHFTLDTNAEGPDHKLSADPNMLKHLVEKVRMMESIMGSGKIQMQECEKDILQYRRKS